MSAGRSGAFRHDAMEVEHGVRPETDAVLLEHLRGFPWAVTNAPRAPRYPQALVGWASPTPYLRFASGIPAEICVLRV